VYMDPAIPDLVAFALVLLLVGLVTRRLRQPHVVGYIIAGVLLGPFGAGVVTDGATMTRLGAFGVLLLVFFIGMEVPLRDLVARWKAPILGTALQVAISVACVWPVGVAFDWPFRRVVFLGFVISMSSTAVIIDMLRGRDELHRPIGGDVTGISVAQDLAVIPMLLVLGLLAGEAPDAGRLARQTIGGTAAIALFVLLARRGEIGLPLARHVQREPEMQVFAALFACFGMALLTGLMDLSGALGAFLAGAVLAAGRQAEWVRAEMDPFRIVFVGLFFVSVGMLIDLDFIRAHALVIALLVAIAFVVNTGINALVLRVVGHPWPDALVGGAMLAQIGEFGFVLAAVGQENGIISEYAHQTSVAVICLSLLLSPAWLAAVRRSVHR